MRTPVDRHPVDNDLTLPSVVSALGAGYVEPDLVLTIVFHPDTSRIGQRAVVPRQRGKAPWILGRRCPDFGDSQGESPLEDPHVSRQALQLTYTGKSLEIRRFEDASRCRLAERDLYERVELSREQLRTGIPLMLGHAVVLMLRLDAKAPQTLYEPQGCQLLRGSSAHMVGIREQVARAAASDLDVLIRGETGTGKELVATAIHQASDRREAPFVRVNMAAVPAELAAAALFGSARGAFTGADKTTEGYFGQAEGGSLFLDEIGDASTDVQPQLLRALQQREIQVVGGTIRQVDLRVISATDADLDGDDSSFKAALRYRLGACEIALPALRDHPEDVGELMLHFIRHSALECGRVELLPRRDSPARNLAAWAVLFYRFLCYSWPGNVRELANFSQQVVLASDKLPTLPENLVAILVGNKRGGTGSDGAAPLRKMQEVDQTAFDYAMAICDFEVLRVAEHLGVSRGAVYRRIEASDSYRLISEIPDLELQAALERHQGDCEAAARSLRVPLRSLRSRLGKMQRA